jgi:hypothetical protein
MAIFGEKSFFMKKLVALLGLAVCSVVYGLPVNNPVHPDLLKDGVFGLNVPCGDYGWGVEFGYRGELVFDHRVKNRNALRNLFNFEEGLCKYRSTTSAGQLTLNFWDQIDIYGWMGASQSEFANQVDYLEPFAPFHTGFLNLHGSTREGFAYGYGVRVLFWECGPIAVGVEGQYARTKSKLECLTINGHPIQSSFFLPNGDIIDSSHFTLKRRQYQVSLGVSYRMQWFIPYIAVKYSNIRTRFIGPDFVSSVAVPPLPTNLIHPELAFRNMAYFGGAAGFTIVDTERMELTAEASFIDEYALAISADFRF